MAKQKPIELMHYSFGVSDGNTCGTCCNLRIVQYNDKRFRKCAAYGGFHSNKADWAMRWEACGLYSKPVSYQMISDTAKRTFARIGIYRDDTTQLDRQMRLEALKDGSTN